jgi:hypothetical protein
MPTYELHQVDREAESEGWIWVREDRLKKLTEDRRPVLRLSYSTKNRGRSKSVCCETLWADDAWLSRRHKPIEAAKLTSKDNLVFLSAWYRHRLGIEEKHGKINLEIPEPKSALKSMYWQLRACAAHPQIAVVMSTVLAVVGTGLAIVGLAFTLKDLQLPGDIWVGEGLATATALLGFVVCILGFWPLYSRGKN